MRNSKSEDEHLQIVSTQRKEDLQGEGAQKMRNVGALGLPAQTPQKYLQLSNSSTAFCPELFFNEFGFCSGSEI